MHSEETVPGTSLPQLDYYELVGPMLRREWDDNFHFAYWLGPDDQATVEEATDRFTDLLIPKLGVGVGARVLDVGCGLGKPAVRLAQATGANVLGITISGYQIEIATGRAAAEGLADQVRFQQADGTDMPFEDGSFDAALAFESIVHMDRAQALAEMGRVVAPGGRVVLTDLFDREDVTDEEAADRATRPGALPRLADYPALLEAAGLVADEISDISENVSPSFTMMNDITIANKDELAALFGFTAEQSAEAESMVGQMTGELGCVLIVAHRRS
ncbi:methyltransferase domain-containing protein [Streptomyces sp. RY43-2]|uniref:Methyltransferase domain-containing protein n=1 Tax=Streptomyces macrolidinus TaxID=2952607 RepID=A0ABT0ZJ36_9ACTN|nr:methyltransferase domain-containing protein [Streptomyces macrolidinus]MCN9243555.1 methyltransferase domain-containing protein [Streptomyces macrolidinus]